RDRSDPMTHGSDTGGATALSRAMETIRTLRERLAEHSTHTPLAVVGMGLRAPGGITDPGSYWDALASGKDLTGPLPESRRGPFGAAWEDHPTEGGYLDRVLDFDAGFFGMENSQAAATDPQPRLLLEVAWESLEDAALPPGRIDG